MQHVCETFNYVTITFIKLNQDDRCSYMGQYNVKFTPPQFYHGDKLDYGHYEDGFSL